MNLYLIYRRFALAFGAKGDVLPVRKGMNDKGEVRLVGFRMVV
jgi:hypothetical protein